MKGRKNESIISGTLRLQDLVPALLAELEKLDKETAEPLKKWLPAEALEDDDNPFWESEGACILLENLFYALDWCAPRGYYFGAHPGNGSDIGFWSNRLLA